MKQVYESKRDSWLVVMLWIAATVMLVVAWNLWEARAPFAFRLLLAVLFILMAVFMLWVLYGTRYTLTDSALIVQSGPFRWVIDFVAISEVFPTRNPISSPACSLDRLHIRYHSSPSGLMISPQDKMKFLLDLVARSPGLRMEGDKLLRDTRLMAAVEDPAHTAQPGVEVSEK